MWSHMFVSSALVRGEWRASRPNSFAPEDSVPVPLDRGSMGLRACVDAVEERTTYPARYSSSDALGCAASRYTDCATAIPGTVHTIRKRLCFPAYRRV
jgi:hypothetical protein